MGTVVPIAQVMALQNGRTRLQPGQAHLPASGWAQHVCLPEERAGPSAEGEPAEETGVPGSSFSRSLTWPPCLHGPRSPDMPDRGARWVGELGGVRQGPAGLTLA